VGLAAHRIANSLREVTERRRFAMRERERGEGVPGSAVESGGTSRGAWHALRSSEQADARYRRYASGRTSSSTGNFFRASATRAGSTSATSTRSESSPSSTVSPHGSISAESPV